MSSATTDFTTKFNPSIQLNENENYELALLNLTTYNSASNINKTNNFFTYWTGGVDWEYILIPEGAYELQDIFNLLEIKLADPKLFKFYVNINTGCVEINTLDYDIIFDFDHDNYIGKILGFERK